MPYIPMERRYNLLCHGDTQDLPTTPGELAFLLCNELRCYLDQKKAKGELRYADLAEVLGALETARAEFYRKVVVPYEDMKEIENGGVF